MRHEHERGLLTTTGSPAAGAGADLLEALAGEVGTPAYVYHIPTLRASVARWTAAVAPDRISYAVKANANLALLGHLAAAGLGFEVATPGEYARVREAGVGPARVVFGGVPKAGPTVALARDEGVSLLVLQSESEVRALEALDAGRAPRRRGDGRGGGPADGRGNGWGDGAGGRLRAGLRVRPSIRAGAHPSLHTGTREAKFGLRPEEVPGAWRRLAALGEARPAALAVHIGSGLEDVAPYGRAADLLLDLAAGLPGPPVEEIDLGGGLGIDYGAGEDPDPAALGALADRIEPSGPAVRFEPGRSLVARCGTLLTRVLYRWSEDDHVALVCDAGFTDFARHVLYGAEHRIEPVGGELRGSPTVSVLGPTCESGDRLGTRRRLHGVGEGDLLVLRDAGAYGSCMASHYMGRPRPAEVLVEDGRWRVVRERERPADLWRGESGAAL